MSRRFLRRHQQKLDAVRSHPLVYRYARFLDPPSLWHLNRRSVAAGVAVGLFTGLIPGPFQMLAAALVAVLVRANLPVAVVTTLYTNPLTILPLYLVAWWLGELCLGAGSTPMPHPPQIAWHQMVASAHAWLQWLLSQGKPLALGLVVLAAGLALLGWLAVRGAWRLHVLYTWRKRRERAATQIKDAVGPRRQ